MSHEIRCENTRKLIGDHNLIQLFGKDGSGGVALHTILQAGLGNLDDRSVEKAAAQVMVDALNQSGDTRRMHYRDFFTRAKADWMGTSEHKDVIVAKFRGETNEGILENFVLPHAQHIQDPETPDPDRMDRMTKLIDALIADPGAGNCTRLRDLTLNQMHRHIEYNVAQFYIVKVACKEGLLTEDPRRRVVADIEPLANNRCATFDSTSLSWNCNTVEQGAKCTIIDGVPSLLSNICD